MAIPISGSRTNHSSIRSISFTSPTRQHHLTRSFNISSKRPIDSTPRLRQPILSGRIATQKNLQSTNPRFQARRRHPTNTDQHRNHRGTTTTRGAPHGDDSGILGQGSAERENKTQDDLPHDCRQSRGTFPSRGRDASRPFIPPLRESACVRIRRVSRF